VRVRRILSHAGQEKVDFVVAAGVGRPGLIHLPSGLALWRESPGAGAKEGETQEQFTRGPAITMGERQTISRTRSVHAEGGRRAQGTLNSPRCFPKQARASGKVLS
jgi:hypothetical protein